MLEILSKGIAKIFGTKSERDLKNILPIVPKINAEFENLRKLSDDKLREETQVLKAVLAERLKEVDTKIAELNERVKNDKALSIHQKESIYAQIDKLEEDRNKQLEVALNEILPRAFAVVKETARRYKENEKIEVTASEYDKAIALKKPNVEIVGDKAIWHRKWMAAGSEIVWDMVHFDVQLIGGMVLHEGKIAEMSTGEGKTLVATLPTYLNALAGRGVHIVTVNDYLAKRDSEWMAPLFEFHKLSVDCIDKHRPNSQERRKAYQADVTYGTNNEFGFDYLRDNMASDVDELVQRKHHYAMVDEVDSVLIDDARTPLIISGPVPKGDEHEFQDLKPRIARLVEEQKKLATQFLNDAKRLLKEGKDKEGGLALFRAYRGLPKHKPLIKFLSETGNKVLLQKTENIYIAESNKLMPEADEPLLFTIDEKTNNIELTDKGIDLITNQGEDTNFFIMPDLSLELDAVEKDTSMSEQERMTRKEAVISDYSKKAQRIHSVNQLLKAYTLFEKDTEYIVVDSKVKIVDEQTGRVMEGRRYSDGLHQALEAKENVKVEDATQTYATITLQNYFRMYHKLAGMTGTAETEAGEFWEIYKLEVVVVPTNRPIQRDDRQDLVYKTAREKFNAVVDETVKLTQAGRPVLIGTTSVEISEILSRMFKMRGIKHEVLNAKQHAREADIVAEAGKPGAVTIATNMAGRGTDIKLTPESKQAGGLAIIGTERHESRRVDRQLRGRAGRQGDVGSSQFFVSLEDSLMRLFGSDRISKVMDRLGLEEGEVIQHPWVSKSIERAQKKVEENNFSIRKRLLEYDNVMNAQREVIYKRRRNALYGERVDFDVLNNLYDVCDELATLGKNDVQDYENFKLSLFTAFGYTTKIEHESLLKLNQEKLAEMIFDEANEFYDNKNKGISSSIYPVFLDILKNKGDSVQNVNIPFVSGDMQLRIMVDLAKTIESKGSELITSLHKYTTLSFIDQSWTEHLREMDDLKQSVQNATFEQKDPLLIYKFEGFGLFKNLIQKLNSETTTFLFKAGIPVRTSEEVEQQRAQVPRPSKKLNEQKADMGSLLQGGKNPGAEIDTQAPQVTQPLKSQKVAGRNDKVTVQYTDGTVVKEVKYKNIEQDILDNKCVLLEVHHA